MNLRSVRGGTIFTVNETRDLVRAGGEGAVFDVGGGGRMVAKVYHDPADRRPKLEAMLRNPPADDATPGHSSIAWPVDILEEAGGRRRFMGFLMPKVERASGFHEVSNPALRARKHPGLTYRDLHVVASNAASAFWALHQKGYVVGDVNEGNLLIRDDALATVVDTDSFQVPKADGTTFRCRVGREEFTPPELQGATLADIDRSAVHDLFGMGVLLFQLLMEGFHPFSGVPTLPGEAWPLGRRIAQGNFPWGGTSKPFKVPPLAPPFETLDPRLQKLFVDAFESHGNGGADRAGRARPNARLWKREIDEALQRLRRCPANKKHWFGGHLAQCPWCQRDAKFVRARARQRQVTAPPDPPAPVSVAPAPKPAPPPIPIIDPAKYAEIQPGRWRLHPNQQLVQMTGGMVTGNQVYDLEGNGSLSGRGHVKMLGIGSDFTVQGYWSYDYRNKLLAMDGTMTITGIDDGDPFTKWLGGGMAMAMPPQPFNVRMSVLSGSAGRYMVRDASNGVSYLLERL